MDDNKVLFYENLIGRVSLAAVLLVPLFWFPWFGMSQYVSKFALLATLVLIGAAIFLSLTLFRGKIFIPKQKIVLALIALSAIATFSSLVNGSFTKSFFGTLFEVNTAGFLAICVLFTLLISFGVKNPKTLFNAIAVFILSACLLLLSLVAEIFGLYGWLPSSVTSFLPSYLALSAVDTAIVMGAASLVALHALTFDLVRDRSIKVILSVLVVGSLLFAGALGFKIFIIFSALFSLAYFVYCISVYKKLASPISLITLVLSIILLLGGSSVSNMLSGMIKISNTDVRPNFSSTSHLILESWREAPVLGIGPNKFANLWNTDKPVGVNLSGFWNTNFTNGSSFLMTFMAETGLLGSLALLLFFALFAFAGLKNAKKPLALSIFFAAAYLWVMALTYSVGLVPLALAFLLTGFFIASTSEFKEINLFGKPILNFASAFTVIVLVLCLIVAGFGVWKRVVASAVFNRGETVRAAEISPSEIYYQESAKFYFAKLQSRLGEVGESGKLDEVTRAELQTYVGNSVSAAKNAVMMDDKNYVNYMILGSIFESLGRSGVAGALDSAKTNYTEAAKLSPLNPAIPLVFARFAVSEGDIDGAFQYVEKSLALKPNFTDAYFLKAQIEASRNNAEGAVRSVEDATLVDPQNPAIYFQLGILKYNLKDWKGTINALLRAVELLPGYANARYFLGLAYSNVGENTKAIEQFVEIQKTNPDNEEVKLILTNLRAGREAFQNAKPPVDNKPEKRKSLPIEE